MNILATSYCWPSPVPCIMRRNYRLFKDLTTGNRSFLSESTNPRYPVYNPLSIPQNQIQLHQSGFTEEEIRTYILEKISEVVSTSIGKRAQFSMHNSKVRMTQRSCFSTGRKQSQIEPSPATRSLMESFNYRLNLEETRSIEIMRGKPRRRKESC